MNDTITAYVWTKRPLSPIERMQGRWLVVGDIGRAFEVTSIKGGLMVNEDCVFDDYQSAWAVTQDRRRQEIGRLCEELKEWAQASWPDEEPES